MPVLNLINLECLDREEFWIWDADNPYLRINGRDTFVGQMREGDSTSLTHLSDIIFTSNLKVELWEDDGSGNFWDDRLGSFYAESSEAGQGEHYFDFTQGGAHYQLTYEVIA